MTRDPAETASLDGLVARLASVEAQLALQRTMIADIKQIAEETRRLVGPSGIPVSSTELLVQTLFGVKFYVPSNDQIMTPQLVVYRQWEAKLSRLMLQLSPAGSVFVDVGANLGYFTCLVAATMGQTPGSRVIAVEPNPEMLRLLAINTRINWSMSPVRIVPAALAEQPGVSLLQIPTVASCNASLATAGVDRDSEATQTVEVEVRRLDDVLRDEPQVDLLKVDVEGFETAVFRGGTQTLRRPGLRIVFEWAQQQMRAAGFVPSDLLGLLRDHAYRLFDAERYLDDPAAAERTDDAILATGYGNLLAARDA